MGNITEHFSREEFMCRCGCGKMDIDVLLVEKLQMIRHATGITMHITSGCRCEAHNASPLVKGKKNSAHLRGKAVDIMVLNSNHRYRFLKQAFKLFQRIEVPDGPWIHLDIDETLPQDICATT